MFVITENILKRPVLQRHQYRCKNTKYDFYIWDSKCLKIYMQEVYNVLCVTNLVPSYALVGFVLIVKHQLGLVARMGEKRGVYRILVGQPEWRKPLEDPGVDGRIILRRIFWKWDVGPRTRLIWLRIGTGDRHLWMRQWTFGFHKMRGIYWLAESRLASQEGFCCMEWVKYQCMVTKYL